MKPLAEECFADDLTQRPTMVEVSNRLNNVKEKCSRQHLQSQVHSY